MSGLKAILALALAFIFSCAPGTITHAGNRMDGVPRHRRIIDGLLEYRIKTDKNEYLLGERVIVRLFITNHSKEPIDLCRTCYLESVGVAPTKKSSGKYCGSTSTHPPGYKTIRAVLGPGDTRQEESNVTHQSCGIDEYGPGEYTVHAVYCHEGPEANHGIDSPEYCVEAEPITIRIRARGHKE